MAFGGEYVILWFGPSGAGSWLFELLPYLVLGVGLVLAFRVARRAHRERASWEPGLRCAACGYDLRATPEKCPECGVEGTAEHVLLEDKSTLVWWVVSKVMGILTLAVVMAAAIMVHVQISRMPMVGH